MSVNIRCANENYWFITINYGDLKYIHRDLKEHDVTFYNGENGPNETNGYFSTEKDAIKTLEKYKKEHPENFI